ncbi:GtrA family protein [Luteibacter sp. NPDC031894]|uniref:GtrA family protein n=1 Tax=Luteibacter sp. NPDC031894 TaxID=3390572 RepID=UPI003D059E8B
MMRGIADRARAAVAASSFLRFLISGGANTAATYLLYLALIQVMGYKIAYTIAYLFGIVLAFVINRFFVFQTHRGWRSMLLFPFVYLAQYLASMLVLRLWIDEFHQSKEAGPIIAIIVTVPLTYALSRLVFHGRRPPN